MCINGQAVQNMGSGLFADLECITSNLVAHRLNQTNGSRNQHWRFIPVNAGKNLFVIQNVFTSGYASVDSPEADQVIKQSLTSVPWQVIPVDCDNANFIIKLPNTSLVWSVNGKPKSNVKIIQANGMDDQKQQWRFTATI